MARTKKTVKKSKTFVAETPNPAYTGKTAGVQFWQGKALISNETIDKMLGFSIEDVVKKLEDDFGYQVTELVEE
jgi:hypothetical protein